MTDFVSKKSKAVVLISGGGSNLQAFIDQINDGELDLDIKLVISNVAQAYGLTRANLAGINTECIDHKAFKSRLDFDQSLIASIDRVEPDIVILAGFMRILTPEFVNHFANKPVSYTHLTLPTILLV